MIKGKEFRYADITQLVECRPYKTEAKGCWEFESLCRHLNMGGRSATEKCGASQFFCQVGEQRRIKICTSFCVEGLIPSLPL